MLQQFYVTTGDKDLHFMEVVLFFEHLPCVINNKQNIFIYSLISVYACGVHVCVFICVCTSCVTLSGAQHKVWLLCGC